MPVRLMLCRYITYFGYQYCQKTLQTMIQFQRKKLIISIWILHYFFFEGTILLIKNLMKTLDKQIKIWYNISTKRQGEKNYESKSNCGIFL